MRKYFLYACLLFAGVFTACDNDDSDGIDPSIPFYQNLGVEYNVDYGGNPYPYRRKFQ